MTITAALALLDFAGEMTDTIMAKIERAKQEGAFTVEEQAQLRARRESIKDRTGFNALDGD